MSPQIYFNFFQVLFYVFGRGEIPAKNLYQLLAAAEPIQILILFFVQYRIKHFFGFYNAKGSHNFRIQKIIFKGIIF